MQEKVVIITGASSGIGRALAERYAMEGWCLVLAARREERLYELKSKLKTEVLPVKTDVTQEDECKALIKKALEKFGRIDVLINNAGISQRALFKDTDLKVLHRLMEVNFWGTVYCTKYAIHID